MIKISKCMANRMAGQAVTVVDAGSQISFTAPSTISTTQGDFITKGFRPGLTIKVTNSSSNDGTFTIASLTGSAITVSETTVTTEAASAATPTITVPNGQSWKSIINYGIFVVYTSPEPDVNAAATGTKLLEMTIDGGSFTPGVLTNGITWEFDSNGKIQLTSGVTIKGAGIVDGTAYYGRLYGNAYIESDDSTNLVSVRIQGRVGTNNSQDFNITSTAVKAGVSNSLTSFNLTQLQQRS